MSWPGSLKAHEVQPATAFCHSAKHSVCVIHVYVLWVLFTVVCQVTQASESSSIDHVIDCVFLPAHVISRAGYTQFVRGLIGSEACRVGSRGGRLPAFLSCFHCVCLTPGGKLSLRREFSPAFLAVPAPLPPMWSGGCARGNCRWIRWREWRRARPYLLPFPSDPAPILWDRKPDPQFLPSEKGLDAPPVFFRGGGQGGRRWAFTYT